MPNGEASAPSCAETPKFPCKTDYYMGFAAHAAIRSKDSTQVGAALVGPEGEVRITGYNGPPKGVKDLPERFDRPTKYLFASHAEMNVISFAAREGIRTMGCKLYVTHRPCSACARLIIQAGICEVVFGPGTTSMPAEEMEAAQTMFQEAYVACRAVETARAFD